MVLLIDGYNVLRGLYPHNKGRLDKERSQLIRELGLYFKARPAIKALTIVFDAGPFLHASREVHNGVVEMYSGQRSTADRWIVSFIERNSHREIMVVTNDRELSRRCVNMRAEVVSAQDFVDILQSFLAEQAAEELSTSSSILSDFPQGDRIEGQDERVTVKSNEALDLLMEQADLSGWSKHEGEESHRSKKGKSHTLSKRDRERLSKLKKLL